MLQNKPMDKNMCSKKNRKEMRRKKKTDDK